MNLMGSVDGTDAVSCEIQQLFHQRTKSGVDVGTEELQNLSSWCYFRKTTF